MNSILEVDEAVGTINQELFEKHDYEYLYLTYSSNTYCTRIEFLGLEIWCSEDDMREYDESLDDYEPLEGYLRREINKLICKLGEITL